MTDWCSTIVTVLETPRFGKIRKCELCESEQAATAQGIFTHEELYEPCEYGRE